MRYIVVVVVRKDQAYVVRRPMAEGPMDAGQGIPRLRIHTYWLCARTSYLLDVLHLELSLANIIVRSNQLLRNRLTVCVVGV